MSLTARGIDTLREQFPQAYTSLLDLVDGVNQVAAVSGVGAVSPAATPQNNGTLDVIAADGIFDVAITDPNPNRGEYYFLEWDTDPSFGDAIVISLGPSRNWRGMLGNIVTFWRWYKQLLGSNVSGYAIFGGNTPTEVDGGGSLAGPAPHDTQGSGTSAQPGNGWGQIGATQPTPVNL